MCQSEVVNDFPEIAYKFRLWKNRQNEDCINDQKILKKKEIYFTSPNKFNDPFDCRVRPRYELLTKKEALDICKKHIKKQNPHMNREKLRKEARRWERLGLYKDTQHMEMVFEEYMDRHFGIFSLAGNNQNLLLWSHYTDSHRGFCVGISMLKLIEFTKSLFYFDRTMIDWCKVQYPSDDAIPILHPCKIPDEELVKKTMTYKSKDWSYEDEYRFILMTGTNKSITIQEAIIESITLGSKMPSDHKEEILGILKSWTSKPKLYEAKMKSDKFGLDFKPIDY